ncbi:Dyp-type peroxidase [Actinospica durhamensis]|uniref:Dyp-type peroxidase n=1 Tax=Actinospica durhamensis TaxID=1508375 RepID=A0A941EQ44_9ACTN|nr:Dyp-type peroxidase [Actinospica durhamensis]MBR7834468.1 Dyp-type peroxidase [Actinospica durhamensis]
MPEAGALSRRRLFAYTGAVGAAGIAVGAAGAAIASDTPSAASAAPVVGDEQLAFYGTHQPGIAAPAQTQGWLTAFDLAPGATLAQVKDLFQQWSTIAATTMAGRSLSSGDDAMAYGRGPSGLSVTVGVGASLLTKLGLEDRIPKALDPLPAFLNDALVPAASDGDLCVLVGANDGLVAAHTLRALQRAAAAHTTQRWQVNGFADAAGSMPSPTSTPRNLMGQLDGTGNPKQGTASFDQTVYVPATADPAWMRGGSYLVFRKIRMLLEDWDTLDRAGQEAVIGRDKLTGAPLSGGSEFTAPDYDKFTASGAFAIPAGAHIRQASAQSNNGASILRRAFNYYDGPRADGSPDAGLIFLAFQADPATGFTVIQQRLSGADSLSTFIRHEASGLFAILPGCADGDYLGRELFEGGADGSG